jgi:3-methylcrotonyl-CoA carboxylase alpha subunit
MGIATVAVCSDIDVDAAHVREADDHVIIGRPPARESYLSIDAVIAAALSTGAQAIHPGYGFLSENPGFATACEKNGIVFIGPSPAAMSAMALKGAAKDIASQAGVPTISGYQGEDQSNDTLLAEAARIGWPVLLKPVAGGGGKGMRIVDSADSLPKAIAASQREAQASCGDPTLLIEKYLISPRHIEVQVAADKHGNVLHLFERDCSTQRRHQKVVEEAPASGLPEATLQKMFDAARSLAIDIGYLGVGTVEFLVDAAGDPSGPPFYFIEMNTRLQVEHPVTEMITGIDLVELQLQIAAGEAMPIRQDQLMRKGHAIEVRICAEDPAKKFFPSPGQITRLQFPHSTDRIRVDSGVAAGDTISQFYDSLIAKLIVHGTDRNEAIQTMLQALDECVIDGIKSNVGLLKAIIASEAFRIGCVDTNFLEKALPDLLRPASQPVAAQA